MIRAERRMLATIKSENKAGELYSSGNSHAAVRRLEKKGLIRFICPSRRNSFRGGYKAVNL